MSTPEIMPETPQNGAAEPAESKPADILTRIQSDPEFAVESFKKAQANGTKLAQKLKALQPLDEIASRLDGGATAAAQALYEHAAILNHPEVKAIADHYRRTGALPTASAPRSDPSEDEYVDPVEALQRKVDEINARLESSLLEQNRDRAHIIQSATQTHLGKLRENYADIWDVIQENLIEQAENWERSPQGRKMLAEATFETWDNLAKIAIGNNLDAVLSKRAQTRVQQKQGLGTEPSPRTVTTGRETPVPAAEKWKPGNARKLIEDAWRRDGRLV